MSDKIYIEVSRDGLTSGLQVSINAIDDKGNGHGYRIAGPKFNGSGTTLLKKEIDARSAAEIIDYLRPLANLPAPQGASVSPAPEVPSGDAAHQAFLDACENPAPPTEELKAVVRDYGKYAAPAASAVADEARIRAEEAEACAKIAFNDGCGRPDCRACYGGNIAAKIRERIPSTESARLAAEKQVIEAAVHYLKIAGDGNKSQFISENGRFGKSPWQEFREAVTRLTAAGAGGK